MSDRGFFAIDRGVWEHPLFAREKFSEREAWIWLISSAAWEPMKVRVGRGWFELARGQCAFALRFLAEKWMWSEPRVRRFLKRLTDDAAALVSATREATLITICNYNDYQLSRRTDVPNIDATLDVKPTNPRRKEEEIKQPNNQELKKETREAALSSAEPSDFDAFWDEWPNKVGKPAALKAFNSAVKRGAGLWDIQDGLRNYIRDKPPDRPWLNPATFLNQNRWEDQPATVQGSPNGRRTVQQAADDLLEKLRAFDEPAPSNLCDGTGENAVRLLPSR